MYFYLTNFILCLSAFAVFVVHCLICVYCLCLNFDFIIGFYIVGLQSTKLAARFIINDLLMILIARFIESLDSLVWTATPHQTRTKV